MLNLFHQDFDTTFFLIFQLIDGPLFTDPLVLRTCGVIIPSDFVSSGNQILVYFYSDPFIEDTGKFNFS